MKITRDEIARAIDLGAFEGGSREDKYWKDRQIAAEDGADAVLALLNAVPEPSSVSGERCDCGSLSGQPHINCAITQDMFELCEDIREIVRMATFDGCCDKSVRNEVYAKLDVLQAQIPPVSPTPPPDLKVLVEKMEGSLLFAEEELAKKHPRDFRICLQTVVTMLRKDHAAFVAVLEAAGPVPSVERCTAQYFDPAWPDGPKPCPWGRDDHPRQAGHAWNAPPAPVAPSADAMRAAGEACKAFYGPHLGVFIDAVIAHAEATDRRFVMIADAWDFPGTTGELRRRQKAFVDDVRGTK